MVGVSMAAAVATLIVSFTVVYTVLDPFVSDFVSDVDPDTLAADGTIRRPTATAAPTTAADTSAAPTTSGEETPTEAAGEPSPTPTDEAGDFEPDYQVIQRINLRSGPGTSNDVVRVLEAGTELQRIGDDGSPDGTAPDARWLEFRTEDGDEGWIREIDVEET
jgi:hypothetical protein